MYSIHPGAGQGKIPAKIIHWLTKDRHPLVLCVGAATAVLVFIYIVLGSGFISGNGAYWHNPRYDDNAHVSGWLYYKDDSWRFPLFDSQRMNYPDGASIIYTDSIPAVAVVAKVFRRLLPDTWQYFGLFVIAAYALNSVAILWLLRQLGVNNLLGAAFAVVFTCFDSLYNLQFASLFAHFLVIFSLGFYFKLLNRYSHRAMGVFTAVVLASLLVHTYLFAMCMLVYIVTLLALWRHGTVSMRVLGAWAASLGAGLVALVFVSGLQHYTATGYQETLFGTSPAFALDPAALFQKHYTQDEIGTYFGWGSWIIIIAGAVVAGRAYFGREREVPVTKKHLFLLLLCAAVFLFALSNTLFLRGHRLLHIPLPASLLGIFEMFRGSKRFIILLYYILTVGGFVLMVRTRSKMAVMVLIAALVIQIIDVQYFVHGIAASARAGNPAVLRAAQWQPDIAQVNRVDMYPSYSCLFNYRTTPLSGQFNASLELYHLTAEQHKVSNSVRAARRTKDCTREAHAARSVPQAGGIAVYLKDDAGRYLITPPAACLDKQKLFDYGMYCVFPSVAQ